MGLQLLLGIAAPAALLLGSHEWPAAALWVTQCALLAWAALALVDAAIALSRAHTPGNKTATKSNSAPRLALVTGASAGLGKEIATLLAQQGHALVLVARREPLLLQLQEELRQLTKQSVSYVVADLGTAQGVERVIKYVASQQLEVDVLVNNAGASVRGELTSLSMAQVESILHLNVAAATKLTRVLVPGMVKRGRGGRVLVVSSMAGEMANPLAAIYGASKAYLTKFAMATNYELGGTGVQVTAFLSGPLHTEFGAHAQCQGAIYMNMPGRATPRECAQAAIDAMDDATRSFAFDKWTTWFMTTTMAHVLPRNLSATLAGLSMEDPRTLLERALRGENQKTKDE